jgi:hypothetical protein
MGAMFFCCNTLLGMRQRHVEAFISQKSVFADMSHQEQGLLVYDAITNKDVTQLSLYLAWGWPCDKSLNIQPNTRWNALAWSIFFNRLSLVKLLVEKGACIAIETDAGVTAYNLAQEFNRKAISDFLENYYLAHVVPKMIRESQHFSSEMDAMTCLCGTCCMCATMLAWLGFSFRSQ